MTETGSPSGRHEKVRQEYQRFLAALPELLTTIPGKWVVFKDGAVQGAFDDENVAFDEAVKQFGLDSAFAIAPVRPVEPTPITAGVMYAP